jgi:uncharacterized membrane protein YfcA
VVEITAQIGWIALVSCLFAAFLGAILQRLSGQGFGMIAAPIVALMAPEFLPASLLMIGIVVGLSSSVFDLKAIDKRDIAPGFLGRFLGAVIASWIAVRITSPELLGGVVAVIVYIAIVLSILGLTAKIRPISLMIAGLSAGIMGTLTAIGAPPMAILYQNTEARRSAASQNLFFCFGMVVSVSALSWQGLVTIGHITFAAMILPGALLGLLASRPLSGRISKSSVRPISLGLAGCAATVLLLRTFI